MVMNLDLLFPTPIYTGFCEEIDNKELKKIKKVCKQYLNEEGVTKSNVGGKQTNIIVAQYCENKVLNNLIGIINQKLLFIKNELKIEKDIKVLDFWINKNYKNNYNTTHGHGDVLFAVVFYVSTNEKSGGLVIHRPNASEGSLYHRLSPNTDFYFDTKVYKLKPKSFIIFPGWVPHSVLPNDSNKSRISIAFNCHFV